MLLTGAEPTSLGVKWRSTSSHCQKECQTAPYLENNQKEWQQNQYQLLF